MFINVLAFSELRHNFEQYSYFAIYNFVLSRHSYSFCTLGAISTNVDGSMLISRYLNNLNETVTANVFVCKL